MLRPIVTALSLLTLAACSGPSTGSSAEAEASARVSPRDAVAQADLVVDVRSPSEYASGHLDKAINIPVDELDGRLAELDAALGGDRSKKIAVYCASGRRSDSARALLQQAGFSAVTNAGGYGALK
jgi:phage shock protein E